MAEIAAWVGGGAALILAVTAVWLAVRLAGAERRVSAAVAAQLAAETEAERAVFARDAAEHARDAAIGAIDREKKALADCRRAGEALYARLRETGAPGAGSVLDDDIRRLYPDADDHGHEDDPDHG